MNQPITYHSDPTFELVHALLVEIPAADRALLPRTAFLTHELARFEFTEGGLHQPAKWMDPGLPDDVTAAEALELLDQALGELIESSTALPDTLRYLRTRSRVGQLVEELAEHAETSR